MKSFLRTELYPLRSESNADISATSDLSSFLRGSVLTESRSNQSRKTLAMLSQLCSKELGLLLFLQTLDLISQGSRMSLQVRDLSLSIYASLLLPRALFSDPRLLLL